MHAVYDHIIVIAGADVAHILGTDIQTRRRAGAMFLLKLKEHRRVTQTAIDDVVENCQCLFQQTLQTIQAGVNSRLAEHGLDPETVAGLKATFTEYVDPFDGLENKYRQEMYYIK